ncbi:MAG: hypothetical protein FH747_17125 [Stenotrophomonas sp.]|uniref:hypothetical protein n=1 Tax=Stenotrophomonas sp. TaxID=69392 RepID=UPI00135297B3|nr:hypothetical protein [Stenotrophomonas sp.]MTI75351.1 hypothetical protein [Stenotrophomonas sp.]
MKMKYTAAFALAAWLLVAGWLASMVVAKPAVLRMGNQAEDSAAMAELRDAMTRNRKAAEGLNALRAVTAIDQAPLVALPATTTGPAGVAGATASEIAAGTEPAVQQPQLSMVLDNGGRRVAVFNGEQVRPGSRLANGDRVRKIGLDWISISGTDGSHTVHRVRSQFEPLTGGGTP